MSTAAEVGSAVLMLLGALSCLLGAIGLVRLPDLPARLQAATKPQTLGLALVLLGAALRVELVTAATLMLVVLFQVITAPVVSQLVGRAAYRVGAVRGDALVVDELAEHLPHDRETDPAGGAVVDRDQHLSSGSTPQRSTAETHGWDDGGAGAGGRIGRDGTS
ncbi:MAG: sodium:proton antiporter [Pseudonocardia sp.]|nr:sodium:proton antiporter [Pseudonocardia sp.]